MRISGPVSAIIVALIFTIGVLFGTGAFKKTRPTYATVYFDGGYQKLGVISSERIYTEATITLDGEELISGDFEEVVAWMREGEDDISTVTWKDGVVVSAYAGIDWVGSESSFRLTTESLELISDGLLRPINVFEQFKKLEQKAKESREMEAKQALNFSESPNESFLLSKILSLFK